eukprot:m51a1_g9547 hypothetical protein (356) ;mRNA; f:862452-863587
MVLFAWAVVLPLAVVVQWFKTMLGMGWGAVLGPILLSLGYGREQVVVSLLLTEFLSSIFSALLHHLFSNVQLRKDDVPPPATGSIQSPGSPRKTVDEPHVPDVPDESATPKPSQQCTPSTTDEETAPLLGPEPRPEAPGRQPKAGECLFSRDVNTMLILGVVGALGTAASVAINAFTKQSEQFGFAIKLYMGSVIILMSLAIVLSIVLRRWAEKSVFSYWKVLGLALWSGFNKGISGGGSGPIVVTGLMLSGMPERNSIGVTPFSEIIVCGVGSLCYLVSNVVQEGPAKALTYYELFPALAAGALPVIPFAAYMTKRVKKEGLKWIVAAFTLLLGTFSIVQSVLAHTGHWPRIKH